MCHDCRIVVQQLLLLFLIVRSWTGPLPLTHLPVWALFSRTINAKFLLKLSLHEEIKNNLYYYSVKSNFGGSLYFLVN